MNASQPQLMKATEGSLHAELPLYIDSTMLTCFRSCPQKFFKEFCLGVRPIALSIDLHAGGCFALGIETIYKKLWLTDCSLSEAIAFGAAAFFSAWGDVEAPPRKTKSKDRVWAAVEDYVTHYGGRTDHITPYIDASGKPTFEYTFAIPLEPAGHEDNGANFPLHPVEAMPFLYSGRFDLLGAVQPSGRPCVRDEKTTTSIGQNWAAQWNLRNQFIGYKWACNECGIPVEDVVVRGVGILKESITQVEAIVNYSHFLIGRWHAQLRRDMWRLARCWTDDYFDFNLGDACTQYGNCTFMDSCRSALTEEHLSGFEIRRWNPLFKNPINGEATGEAGRNGNGK